MSALREQIRTNFDTYMLAVISKSRRITRLLGAESCAMIRYHRDVLLNSLTKNRFHRVKLVVFYCSIVRKTLNYFFFEFSIYLQQSQSYLIRD